MTSAAVLPNGALIFGPRADAPLPATIRNVIASPGKPPTSALVAQGRGQTTVFSDGAPDTTRIATGVGMTTVDGVLMDIALSSEAGPWTIVVAGERRPWPAGARLDVAADGHTFSLTLGRPK